MQLLSYVVHRHSVIESGFNAAAERGYSIYLFSDNPGDYCVLNEVDEFKTLRNRLAFTFSSMEILAIFIVPLLMVSTYKLVKKSLWSHMYFVRAIQILIIPLIGFFYFCNISAINSGLKPTTFSDVHKFCDIGIAFAFVLPVADLIFIIVFLFCIHKLEGSNSFEVVCEKRCEVYVYRALSITSITVFIQFIIFNIFYVLLAAVASPVQTGSLILLYITSFFSLLTFFALILKILITTIQLPEIEKKWKKSLCIISTYSILLLLLVIAFTFSIYTFIEFVYKYTDLIQEYRNDRGGLVFFSSVIASALAYFWTKIGGFVGNINATQADSGNDSEFIQADPGNGSESIQADPGNGSKSIQADPGNDSESIQADPGNGSKSIQADPGNGSKSIQADPGNGSKSMQADPGNGTESLQADPGNGSESLQDPA